MKILSGLFGLVVLLFVLSFALSNQQDITLSLWPFFDDLHGPLYLAGLVPLAMGIIAGGLWGWVASLRHRYHSRRLKKELAALNDRINELQRAAVDTIAAAPRKSFWRMNR